MEVARQRWKRLQAGPREQDIDQARCDLESAEVNLQLARQKAERLDRLYKRDSGAVGLEEHETAQADAQRCRSLVSKARSYLAILLEGTRPEEKAEAESLKTMSELAGEILPQCPLAVLSGPSFAGEVARGLPTAVTIASRDPGRPNHMDLANRLIDLVARSHGPTGLAILSLCAFIEYVFPLLREAGLRT